MSKTIAWIEDDSDIIGGVVEPLESAGYQVLRFRTAEEALENLDQLRASDLLLLDLIMPTKETARRYCQMLWTGTPSAASIQGVGMNSSSGSDCSISASPFGNSTPALTRATR
mgnify:CR=1 FL=1